MPPAQVRGPQPGEPSTWTRSMTRKTDRRPAPWATGPAPAGPALRDSSRVTVHRRLEAEPAALLLGRQCCDPSAALRADACWLPGRACRGSGRWQRCRSCTPSREGGHPGSCLGARSVSGVAGGDKWPSLGSTVSWRTEGGSHRLQAQQRCAGTPSGNGAEPQLGASCRSWPGPCPVST